MPSEPCPEPVAFGLIVVGDEVLNGPRVDRHLTWFRTALAERGHALAWHWVLPDDPEVLTAHLRFSLSRPDPVFVCGGIGATPDDHTRACAASAAGVALVRHPEAQARLEGRFGDQAYPFRIRMADLPRGCDLIENPLNQIPGFVLKGHWFLPGFPHMAWPMAAAVLDAHYPPAELPWERAVRVQGVPESRLVPVMEALATRHPQHKLFSLPHMGDDPHILLGWRGRGDPAGPMGDLLRALTREGIEWSEAEDALGAPVCDPSS
jgi:molybdopterin-biosynthesis enzyme MoeA-like protein